jgi:signal transduction histidine kinase
MDSFTESQPGDLLEMLEALKNGDFTARLRAAEDDPPGMLAATFNDMMEQLAALRDRVDRAARKSGVRERETEEAAPDGMWADLGYKIDALVEKHQTMAGELARVTAEAGSEQRRAEQALYRSRRHLHLVISSMPNMLLLVGEDDHLSAFMAPPGFPPILEEAGAAPHEALVDVLPAGMIDPMLSALATARETGRTSTFEHLLDLDGEALYFEIKVSPITDSDEVLVVIDDITQKRREQLALVQMKDEFIASVSHELRTPLAALRGFLELLLKGMVTDPDVQQDFLMRASERTDYLIKLVNDLLDITRLEAGHLRLKLDVFDVRDTLAAAVGYLQALAGEKDIPLTCEPGDTPLFVRADSNRLQQVLTNLIGNAIKFSEAGQPIRVTGELADQEVLIRVIDHGPGIAPDSVSKLFDKFYQTDDAARRAGSGTGLGLYISKGIIEAHEGRIGVESEVGQGSTFFFALPVSAATT